MGETVSHRAVLGSGLLGLEVVDQLDGLEEPHAQVMVHDGLHADGGGKMGLAGARAASEYDVVRLGGTPAAASRPPRTCESCSRRAWCAGHSRESISPRVDASAESHSVTPRRSLLNALARRSRIGVYTWVRTGRACLPKAGQIKCKSTSRTISTASNMVITPVQVKFELTGGI
jgi:hypothetical protein